MPLPSRLAALAVQGDGVRGTGDVGVPGVARVTEQSMWEMSLAPGQRVAGISKTLSAAV